MDSSFSCEKFATNCGYEECAFFTLVAFQGLMKSSAQAGTRSAAGYLILSLFTMIDLKEKFLPSATDEDHLADLLLWLITLEVSFKDLSQ